MPAPAPARRDRTPAERRIALEGLSLEARAACLAAERYIQDFYQDNPALALVARHARHAPFQLHRAFRAFYGLSIKQRIDELRIQRGMTLLLAGLPTEEVASRLGFTGLTPFVQRFAQITGLTPSRWLKAQPNIEPPLTSKAC
jgi:AraC-like DNA-binding protein